MQCACDRRGGGGLRFSGNREVYALSIKVNAEKNR